MGDGTAGQGGVATQAAGAGAPGGGSDASKPPVPTTADETWTRERWEASVAWCIGSVLLIGTLFLLLRALPTVGWPLVLAGFGAYMLDPLVTRVSKRGLSRSTVAALVVGTLVVGAVAILAGRLPALFGQLRSLPGYVEKMLLWAGPLLREMGMGLPASWDELLEYGRKHAQELLGPVGSMFSVVLGGSLGVLSALMGAVIVPLVCFALLRTWPELLARGAALIPERHRAHVVERIARVDWMLGGFIRGQLTLAFVLTGLYSAALTIIGLKLGLVAGVVTGFGNLVPYVGIATGFLTALGFCLVDFGFDQHLLFVAGAYAMLFATDSFFITPRIVGHRVGLSPATVVVSVLACGTMFGFAGVLLAVPTAAWLKLVGETALEAWRRSETYRGGRAA